MSIDIKELVRMSRGLKLLYVEDDKNARQTTLKMLSNFFQDITIAVDGKDGIEKFKSKKIDLILSDINMPNLNGLEMLKIIRELNSDIPALLLSAHNDSDYFMEAIELDIDGYILKPLVFEQFAKTLFKIVQKLNLLILKDNYQKNLENEVKKRNAELEHKLYFDSLTNLLSRYSFFLDIKKLYSPIILLLDIDKFKVINEVYGIDIGSIVLQKFAYFLQLMTKNDFCKLYRLSADEFAIVDSSKHIDTEKYEELIKNIFKKLHHFKITIDKNIISIDITIGLSTVETNSYESAKIALDYAKKHKKPFMMYSSAIDYRKENSLALRYRDEISLAIDEDRVTAVYQPIVDEKAQIVKYETLMRLKDRGSNKLISPFHFLEVAIKTRLYEQLSSIIVFKALQLLYLTDKILSINFTYSDIKNGLFIQKIENFLSQNDRVGQRTVFEITESESIENYDDVKSFIKRFRKYGVKIAIDDFGSGFSNFNYILEVEPDYLKIDGSLIKDIDTNESSCILVEAIVQFSHKLGIKVIAEFVHSKKIFDMLKELGVDEYQGYYFYEPLQKI
ncbi:MAG: EAL domain-containing protein [Epsilonproteobacteria bacterium]|nr:EAL domain-containing protein [Campylobacterota bacterium]